MTFDSGHFSLRSRKLLGKFENDFLKVSTRTASYSAISGQSVAYWKMDNVHHCKI